MSNVRSIPALQRFKIDEILESVHGPLVAVTLELPSQNDGDQPDHIEFAMPVGIAARFGNAMLDLVGRIERQEAERPPQKAN